MRHPWTASSILGLSLLAGGAVVAADEGHIGREVAIPRHLQNGEEFQLSLPELLEYGRQFFAANWTAQEGAGRPLTKGTGAPVADPSRPLVFPRNFNRISGPDANSCAGCHNAPFGLAGGGGDIVANVFVLGQRFDAINFDPGDTLPTVSSHDETGNFADLDQITNNRNTLGMFGSGYIEMLARQMTAELQTIRNGIPVGGAAALTTKGISFGTLRRNADGTWNTADVVGLPAPSLASTGAGSPPNLILRPFHQAGAVISLRQFTNNAYNHHHGIQAAERFGAGDPDGDGFANEATRADITAASVFQATLAVPGRRIPRDAEIEEAVLLGEQRFAQIGCTGCHVAQLPLTQQGWIYTEPNPYNPTGNLRPGEAPTYSVNLNGKLLPSPRLRARQGVTWVPAYTDLKLHDITTGAPDDPNREPLDMQEAAGSAAFFAGNAKFLTRKLWGTANEPPYFHHGKYTTLREAVLAHAGEAQAVTTAFRALPSHEQDAVIEFLKTLQVLPPGTTALAVDEKGRPRTWPPN